MMRRLVFLIASPLILAALVVLSIAAAMVDVDEKQPRPPGGR